jgi:hypothetical protein
MSGPIGGIYKNMSDIIRDIYGHICQSWMESSRHICVWDAGVSGHILITEESGKIYGWESSEDK